MCLDTQKQQQRTNLLNIDCKNLYILNLGRFYRYLPHTHIMLMAWVVCGHEFDSYFVKHSPIQTFVWYNSGSCVAHCCCYFVYICIIHLIFVLIRHAYKYRKGSVLYVFSADICLYLCVRVNSIDKLKTTRIYNFVKTTI